MNVRIFWVCAMECMCAQTRPLFILSSERGGFFFFFWGGGGGAWSENPYYLHEKKSPLPEKFSSEEDRTHHAASSWTVSPTHHQLSYSGPPLSSFHHPSIHSGMVMQCQVLSIVKIIMVILYKRRSLPSKQDDYLRCSAFEKQHRLVPYDESYKLQEVCINDKNHLKQENTAVTDPCSLTSNINHRYCNRDARRTFGHYRCSGLEF